MRVAMITCRKYQDCWIPFISLFRKFWPDCPWKLSLVTDQFMSDHTFAVDDVYVTNGETWCAVLCDFLRGIDDEEVMLMQEDFLLSDYAHQELIDYALLQMRERHAGCVRLYPCPGSDGEYGDPFIGAVASGSRYRISCQAALWRKDYLLGIAERFTGPADFELDGTIYSEGLPDEVLAWKRDVRPYPLSYTATAIINGEWAAGIRQFCEERGVSTDWSMRPTRIAQ